MSGKEEQAFNEIRDSIDRELRATGFEEFLSPYKVDVTAGRLVVARSFVHTDSTADLDIDLSPLATRLATQHEVGLMIERENSWSYWGLVVSEAWNGNAHSPTETGQELDYVQLLTVNTLVDRLLEAKTSGQIPWLTKSLKKVDPAGD